MRFVTSDEREVSLEQVENMLVSLDAKYTFQRHQIESEEMADIYYDEAFIGQIEINRSDDEIFVDDVSAFRDMIGEPTSGEEQIVLNILDKARNMIVIGIEWRGTDAEYVISRFDPLWIWLFGQRTGFLQADNEGFYDANGLMVGRKFML